MTKFVIKPETSVFQPTGLAFAGSPGNDKLIVKDGGFIVSGDAVGVLLDNDGSWTVDVAGVIFGATGIQLVGGSTHKVTINVEKGGDVGGTNIGINTFSPATIKNSGAVTGGIAGIQLGDGGIVSNNGFLSGSIFSIVDLVDGDNTVSNRGKGTINGDINLAGGVNKLTNSGDVLGPSVTLGAHTDTLTNKGSGDITANINFFGDDDKLTNQNNASITGNIDFGMDDDTLTNKDSASITGLIDFGDGADTFTNQDKATVTGNLTFGFGNDTLTNKGNATIIGNVGLGMGEDTVSNKGKATITGTVDLGDDNDTFNGGKTDETVQDGNGADTVNFSKGDDHYIAIGAGGSDGADTIDGGKGTDLYDAVDSAESLTINLSKNAQDDGAGGAIFIGSIDANTATGQSVANGTTDTVLNFEDVSGGVKVDLIIGSDGSNSLLGNDGSDTLFGLAGDDMLGGGSGNDRLIGGEGADILVGGTNADVFWFLDVSDSGTTDATRDVIQDFEADGAGGELINLSMIDADTSTAGDDAFTFIGTNQLFSGTAGELRAVFSATGQIVEGDVDGDAKADFSFEITDATHAIALSATDDFVL